MVVTTRSEGCTFWCPLEILVVTVLTSLEGPNFMGVFSFVLVFSHLDEEVIVDVMVAVNARLAWVVLEDLVACAWTIHLHIYYVLGELLLCCL